MTTDLPKQLLQKLISIESISGSEKKIADFIFQHLQGQGLDPFKQDDNVVLHINNDSDKCLILNTHMDTVSAGDLGKWSSKPLELMEQNGKFFGLGVSDMKVSIALLLELAPAIDKQNLNLDIFLIFVTNEEVDGSGSESFAQFFQEKYNYTSASCVICEPTNAQWIELGKKGNIFLEINTKGKSAHSSRPEDGVNAVTKMMEVIGELNSLISNFGKNSPILGNTTLAGPTTIHAAGSVNKIPDSCTATVDIRTVPESHDIVVKLIEDFLCEDVEIEFLAPPSPPSLTNENEEIVQVFGELGITNKKYAKGGDDSYSFTSRGIPCVVFGAGSKECIHQPNEFVERENIPKTKEIYLELIEKMAKK